MPGSDPRGTARTAGHQASATAQRHERTIQRVGRFGVAAEGVVYLLIGWLALQIALGTAGTSADSTGALRQVAQSSFGPVLLVLLAIGFAALAAWQALEAAFGDDTKHRVKSAVKGLIALSFGLTCVRLLMGSGGSAAQQQQTWTQRLLEAPGGVVLVVLVGLVVAAVGIATAVKGLKHDFEKKVEGTLSQGLRTLGVVGYVARGVAFTVLGGLIVVAATGDVAKSRGLDAAFHEIASQPYGTVLLLLVAVGIAAFGAFQIVTAPRRREA